MKKNIPIKVFICILIVLIYVCTCVTAHANEIDNNEILKVAETSSNNKTTDPDDANYYLKTLTVDGYDMYPEFNKNTNKYYVSVPTDVSSLDINAEPEVDRSSVKITGNSKLSKTENSITIDVTAKNREVKRYTITVTKQEDNGLKLESLEIEGAKLEPEFSANKYSYKTSMKITKEDDKLKPINVKATPNEEGAEVEIFGNKDIVEGDNLISILLKKGDNTTVYQVTAKVTAQTMVTTFEDTSSDFVKFIDNCKDNIVKWFEDENKKIATFVAGGVVLLIIVIAIIVHIRKKKKSKENAENLKKRAR